MLPHRPDTSPARRCLARRDVLSGRGRDVHYTWLEIRFDGERFAVVGGSRWHQARGRERQLTRCDGAADAVSYANRRLRTMRQGATDIADFTVRELHASATERGIAWPQLPELQILEPAEIFFS